MPLEAIIDACHAINPMIDSMDAYVLFGAAPFNLIKGIILSLLFSACILIRYSYPFMVCVPMLALLILFSNRRPA